MNKCMHRKSCKVQEKRHRGKNKGLCLLLLPLPEYLVLAFCCCVYLEEEQESTSRTDILDGDRGGKTMPWTLQFLSLPLNWLQPSTPASGMQNICSMDLQPQVQRSSCAGVDVLCLIRGVCYPPSSRRWVDLVMEDGHGGHSLLWVLFCRIQAPLTWGTKTSWSCSSLHSCLWFSSQDTGKYHPTFRQNLSFSLWTPIFNGGAGAQKQSSGPSKERLSLLLKK